MSSPISINIRAPSMNATTPSSSYSSTSSLSGLYVPIHRRTSNSSSESVVSTPATTPASSPAKSSIALPGAYRSPIYTRAELLSLAKSPLSQTPPSTELVASFPDVFTTEGGQTERALGWSNSDSDGETRWGRRRTQKQGARRRRQGQVPKTPRPTERKRNDDIPIRGSKPISNSRWTPSRTQENPQPARTKSPMMVFVRAKPAAKSSATAGLPLTYEGLLRLGGAPASEGARVSSDKESSNGSWW